MQNNQNATPDVTEISKHILINMLTWLKASQMASNDKNEPFGNVSMGYIFILFFWQWLLLFEAVG